MVTPRADSGSPIDFVTDIFSALLFFVFIFGLLFSLFLKTVQIHPFLIFLFAIVLNILILVFVKKIKKTSTMKLDFREIGLELIPIFMLTVFSVYCLFSVHFNYSGVSSDILRPEYLAVNQSYAYPYFVDEWYSIAFSQFSLGKWLPPSFNPMVLDLVPFINIQWLFHNINSSIFYLFNQDPVTSYVPLGIAMNVMIVLSSFFILRTLKIDRLPALFTGALLLFITHGSNLPTFWTYLPINLVILTYLLSLLSNLKQNYFLYIFFFFISLFIYPPIILFFIPLIIRTEFLKRRSLFIFIFGIFVLLTSLVFVISSGQDIAHSLSYIFSRVWFMKHSPGIEDVFNPLSVLPPVVVVTLAIAAYSKKIFSYFHWSFLVIIGLFWVAYSFTSQRFIMDFPRLVFTSSVLLVIFSGFGAQKIYDWQPQYRNLFLIVIGCYLSYYGFHYTSENRWEHLTVASVGNRQVTLKPRPPTNTILKNEDLYLFENLKGEFLVSDPWKSTSLAIVRNVKPLFLKSGTISDMSEFTYDTFISDPCRYLSKNWRIKFYIYLPQTVNLKCEGLTKLGQSVEGFELFLHQGKI